MNQEFLTNSFLLMASTFTFWLFLGMTIIVFTFLPVFFKRNGIKRPVISFLIKTIAVLGLGLNFHHALTETGNSTYITISKLECSSEKFNTNKLIRDFYDSKEDKITELEAIHIFQSYRNCQTEKSIVDNLEKTKELAELERMTEEAKTKLLSLRG